MTDSERSIGRLEGKVDLILDSLDKHETHAAEIKEKVYKIEQRVEKWENRAIGGLAVVGVIAGIIGAFLKTLASKIPFIP